jgi:hypothetical protein
MTWRGVHDWFWGLWWPLRCLLGLYLGFLLVFVAGALYKAL